MKLLMPPKCWISEVVALRGEPNGRAMDEVHPPAAGADGRVDIIDVVKPGRRNVGVGDEVSGGATDWECVAKL